MVTQADMVPTFMKLTSILSRKTRDKHENNWTKKLQIGISIKKEKKRCNKKTKWGVSTSDRMVKEDPLKSWHLLGSKEKAHYAKGGVYSWQRDQMFKADRWVGERLAVFQKLRAKSIIRWCWRGRQRPDQARPGRPQERVWVLFYK